MALPTEGELSFSAIATELSISLTDISLRNMSSLAGFTEPDNVSEFYGYSNIPSTATVGVGSGQAFSLVYSQIQSTDYDVDPLPNGGSYMLGRYFTLRYRNNTSGSYYFQNIYLYFTFNSTAGSTLVYSNPSVPRYSGWSLQGWTQAGNFFIAEQNPSAPPTINVFTTT